MRTASVTDRERREMLTALLRGVSRSFYLTMRALPGPVRGPIGLAYLLARTADTIADTATLPPDERLARLLAFRAQVQGAEGSWTVPEAEDPAERRLLEAAPRALALLDQTAEADRARIRSVVITLSEGMEMDLRTFPAVESGEIGALADRAALDRYIYLVAGCVGEFWTEMTMAHDRALRHWDAAASAAAGVRFGKALQLTNVLRDTSRDLRKGRCYMPADELAALGLAPSDLLRPERSERAWPVAASLVRLALEHYAAAESYILAIPRRALRLRLAALWPALIGLRTLEALARNSRWLDPAHPAKISRGAVYRIMARSFVVAPSNTAVRGWMRGLRRNVERALAARGA